ncbi:hypothetical protein EV426DRAFT_628530 [Tirmania nivea]|nr:hypothetical protein EV426DRAFT_628530 [Tirmania nivea]
MGPHVRILLVLVSEPSVLTVVPAARGLAIVLLVLHRCGFWVCSDGFRRLPWVTSNSNCVDLGSVYRSYRRSRLIARDWLGCASCAS